MYHNRERTLVVMMFKVNKGKLEGCNRLTVIDQLRQLVDVSSGVYTITRGPDDLTYPHVRKKGK